jgi:hypothetical protein
MPWRTSSFAITAALLVTLLAGCGIFPSDPKPPPLALRVDNGTISVLVPHCGDEKVLSAAVYDYGASSTSPAIWNASGYVERGSAEVRLETASWEVVSGSYNGFRDIGIDVRTDEHLYGGGAAPADLDNATGLPVGIFYLEGAKVDASGYQKAMEQYPCRPPMTSSA